MQLKHIARKLVHLLHRNMDNLFPALADGVGDYVALGGVTYGVQAYDGISAADVHHHVGMVDQDFGFQIIMLIFIILAIIIIMMNLNMLKKIIIILMKIYI